MATTDSDDGGSYVRSVTPFVDEHPNQEMNVIGWFIFLGLLVVILPLALVFVLVWIVSKLIGT